MDSAASSFPACPCLDSAFTALLLRSRRHRAQPGWLAGAFPLHGQVCMCRLLPVALHRLSHSLTEGGTWAQEGNLPNTRQLWKEQQGPCSGHKPSAVCTASGPLARRTEQSLSRKAQQELGKIGASCTRLGSKQPWTDIHTHTHTHTRGLRERWRFPCQVLLCHSELKRTYSHERKND